mmetsp:Transcript_17589/g.44299  ORF Transcript_17589/g.44299 Transcript_17589/m.44299 type:complete len:81 (+) Transcript_17589:66-308(+)
MWRNVCTAFLHVLWVAQASTQSLAVLVAHYAVMFAGHGYEKYQLLLKYAQMAVDEIIHSDDSSCDNRYGVSSQAMATSRR